MKNPMGPWKLNPTTYFKFERGRYIVMQENLEDDELISLEDSAAIVWAGIFQGKDLQAIFSMLEKEYGPLTDKDKDDVILFIKDLLARQLILP